MPNTINYHNLHAPIDGNNQAKRRWRQIFLVFLAKGCFNSIINKTEIKSHDCESLLATQDNTSTPIIQEDGTGLSPIVSSLSSNQIQPDSGEHQFSVENIARIVREKDRSSLLEFGGVQAIAVALNTHLEDGIPGDTEDINRRSIYNISHNMEAPRENKFWIVVWESMQTYTYFILGYFGWLAFGFGIKQYGAKHGWYDGATIFVSLYIMILLASIKTYRSEQRSRNLLKKEQVANVIRGGTKQQISISNIVTGDIILLAKGERVPADGIFINGHPMQLDGVLDCKIDNQNPFLFCGAEVSDGEGCMLVTSVSMNTVWGETMILAQNFPKEKNWLEVQLDKLISSTQVTTLLIYMLILIVLFARYMSKRKDRNKENVDPGGKPTPVMEFFQAIERITVKPRGKISILMASITVLLVGMQEELPFLMALCVAYWKRKIMSGGGRGIVQKSSAFLTMGFATTICTDLIGKSVSQDDPFGLNITELEETIRAIKDCKTAGVNVKLISEDEVSVVRAAAIEFGMLTENSEALVLKGEDFRNCTEEERVGMVDQITAIGNCLPSDKLLLVQCLKKKGNVVALIGANNLHDNPALRQADIGFVKAEWGTKMARDYLDLMLWDGTWSSFQNIIKCGRCAYENIQKFIQLEVTMIVSGLLTTTVLTISLGEALMTPIQLSWTNLIVPILGGMAVITETPLETLMNKPPVQKAEPLITKAMWRNIIAQVIYQVVILVIFQFKGQVIYGKNRQLRRAMMFNSFVLLQVFNQFNSREIEKINVFKNIHQNYWFWLATVGLLALQVAFVEISGIIKGNARLDYERWGICILIGTFSWAIDCMAKCIIKVQHRLV